MTRIWAIATNTYREAVRQKVLYTLVFFTIVLILFSLFLGQLSLGADVKIVEDMGLASIMLFGALMSIFMGVGLVFKEIDRRTIYTILSKPVSRYEFILGKFLGLAITIALEVAAMTGLLFLMLAMYTGPIHFEIAKAILLIYAELTVLIAVAVLFSSYSSSFMSTLFCISILVLGHLTDDFATFMGRKIQMLGQSPVWTDHLAGSLLSGLAWTLRLFNLDHFTINTEVVHGVPVGWDRIGNALLYAGCWVTLLLSVAVFLFRRKDLQ